MTSKPEDIVGVIPLTSITLGDRSRETYTDIEDLAKDIKKRGLIEPLVVDRDNLLIAGGRRYMACLMVMAEMETDTYMVPVRYYEDLTELERLEIELAENKKRHDLLPYEEVNLKRKIDDLRKELYGDASKGDKGGWSVRKTAALLKESVGGVAQDIMLAHAMDAFPELKDAKTKADAVKKMKAIIGGLAEKELKSRLQTAPNYTSAQTHYKVGDALQGLFELPNRTVAGLAEVDPPYAIDLANAKKSSNGVYKLDEYDEWDLETYIENCVRLTTQLDSVLAPRAWIIWWFAIEYYDMTKNILEQAKWIVDPIPGIWHKTEFAGQTQRPESYLARSYETFFIARKSAPILSKRGRSNVFSFKPVDAAKKIHPTEKPIELMVELIETFAADSPIVIVPFLGSGVTLRAAYALGKTGFGWDLSEANKEKFLTRVATDIEEGVYATNKES